jgi:hypothetical protein
LALLGVGIITQPLIELVALRVFVLVQHGNPQSLLLLFHFSFAWFVLYRPVVHEVIFEHDVIW